MAALEKRGVPERQALGREQTPCQQLTRAATASTLAHLSAVLRSSVEIPYGSLGGGL